MIITHTRFNLVGLCDEFFYNDNYVLHDYGRTGIRNATFDLTINIIKRK